MKSPEEIIELIEGHIGQMLVRPRMFASGPQALEELLLQLDELRKFCLDADPSPGDVQDLATQGFGTATCYHRGVESGTPDEVAWERIVDFWRAYLSSDSWPPQGR